MQGLKLRPLKCRGGHLPLNWLQSQGRITSFIQYQSWDKAKAELAIETNSCCEPTYIPLHRSKRKPILELIPFQFGVDLFGLETWWISPKIWPWHFHLYYLGLIYINHCEPLMYQLVLMKVSIFVCEISPNFTWLCFLISPFLAS